jgi:hypothetical protein
VVVVVSTGVKFCAVWHPGISYRGLPPNEPHGSTSHLNTKTALQLEATEPHTIAIIAILFGVEIHRTQIIYCAIEISLEFDC